MKIIVLAAAARHPLTQLSCRGRDDAAAVELALRIAAANGADIHLVHCGSPDEPSLRGYFGMGIARIVALPADANISEYLSVEAPSLIVTGSRSGFGSGEGLLPYRIASDCDWPLIAAAVDAHRRGNGWEVTQHRPRGARRFIGTSGTTVLIVGEGGPRPRQPAFALSRAGKVEVESTATTEAPVVNTPHWIARPARHRPVASSIPTGSAADRRRVLLQPGATTGRLVVDLPVTEMARELLQQLDELGMREK
jgi:electron transfer flavoprotein beta subunit